jgi:replication factor C subunit 3/5
MTSEINANNITYLVDKYNPKDVNDIFIPEIEYNKEINIISEELNIEENSWKKSLPNKCYFHKEIYKKLKKISEDPGLPHIIFYGNPGSGKKTMINLFLEMVFDKSIYRLDDSKYTVFSSGNIENEVIVKQSDHHLIIEPNNNNFDRYLIQDIVKEYARKYPLYIYEKNRNFKTVQINNLDNLSYYAQTSLRRTIEKYSTTCRFVMWCYSLSKVIEPLRSRCLCIHVPTQSNDDLLEWTFNISSIENIKLNCGTLDYIVKSSNGNLKDILWKLDLYKYCNKVQNEYQKALLLLINEIIEGSNIQIIRDYIYKMLITNISSNIIIKDVLNIILLKINNYPNSKELSTKIIDYASEYEYRLSKGRRDIIHIEAFMMNIINTLQNNNK